MVRALTVILLFSLFLGCTPGAQKISSKPVAKVNDHVLSAKEFSSLLARRLKDLDAIVAKDPNTVAGAKEALLKDFIIRSFILDWARANNVLISEKELDAEVNRYRANYPDDLAFRRLLAEENLSFSDWREKLRYTLIERAFFKALQDKLAKPKEEEIKKYYEGKKDSFKQKERVYLRQILIEDASRVDIVRNELKNKDFSSLAKKYSVAPEGKSGGLVGWVERGSVDFFESAFTLAINVVSPVVRSPFGYHIFRVEKKLPAGTRSLDEMRPLLAQELLAQREQAAFVAWLDGQIRSSHIFRDYDLINSINVDTKMAND